MALKDDIYDALVKNLGEEHISNSSEGQTKVDTSTRWILELKI